MSKTRTRKQHPATRRTQPVRKPAAPQPPLRLVSLNKPTPAPDTAPAPEPLPVREYITHAAITAHYQAQLAGLPTTLIRDWIPGPDGTTTLDRGPHGTLTHTPDAPTPFHAAVPCRYAAHHYPVTTGRDLTAAETAASACTSRHTPQAALRAHHLGTGLHRARTAAEDTQQTDVRTLRNAHDQAKEHPHD